MAADIFGFDDTKIVDMLYSNAIIDKFINSKHSMGISACKGMGKTFILKAKRMKMMKDPSYLILPKNQLVDTPSPIILNRGQINFFSSYYNWVDIWMFCICVYIISQSELRDICLDANIQNEEITNLLRVENRGVFDVLNKLLIQNNIKLLRKAMEYSTVVFQLLQQIDQQVVLFVDKLEEPFNRGYYKIPGSSKSAEGKYNSSIWTYAQLAFAEAVYILYSGRHHVKIFYSIRQEALYGGEAISTEYSKMCKEMMVNLRYSYHDLYNMFKLYVATENDENLFDPSQKHIDACKALCGIKEIKHKSNRMESLWAYIYRHSLGRPRDIMEMCSALYDNIIGATCDNKLNLDDRIRICRRWINQISTRICKEYIYSLEPFMGFEENLLFSKKIEEFLTILPTNVFTLDAAVEYCRQANLPYCNSDCQKCKLFHYFSTLYNIGLLGYIYKSSSEDGYKNSIKHMGDSVFLTSAQTLPIGVLYYAHPGLGNMIRETRERALHKYISSRIVINSFEVFIDEQQLRKLKHLSNALVGNFYNKKVFITSTERDLKNERIKVEELLLKHGYEVVAFESPNFPQMPIDKKGKGATQDHCIDVALSCGHLIYIFDGGFGGRYVGEDYKSYIDEEEIIEIEPSASFVEYLVAKKYYKDVKVYVSEAVDTARGEYLVNGKPKNYHSKVVDENHTIEVFEQLGYFNGLDNGTWFEKYSDISDLEQYLAVDFPNILDNNELDANKDNCITKSF